MENDDRSDQIKKKTAARDGFFIHLLIYLPVMSILIFINIFTADDYYWFKWPLIGWGAILIYHAFRVFNPKMGYRP